jgi:hypothetical protein
MVTWWLGGWVLIKDFIEARKSIDPGWGDMSTDAFFEFILDADPPLAQLKNTVKEVWDPPQPDELTTHRI